MDLLEYQAKNLFAQYGIPVLPSQRIERPPDLKGLKIPYPVVLKSQVRRGSRGKAGGIRFVENTIDAIAAAQAIFHLPILGEYPEVLLAEAKYDAEQEFYLAVVLDRSTRGPVLLGSPQGGIKVESALDTMQRVVLDQGFSPFLARRLAIRMGLTGDLILSVSSILEKMYTLFVEKDLDAIEINPLAVRADGQVMALDGKVTANDNALQRHADLMALASEIVHLTRTTPIEIRLRDLYSINLDGDLGVICNGAGLTMATLDGVTAAGGDLGVCLNLGHEFSADWHTEVFADRLRQSLDRVIIAQPHSCILVNLLCHIPDCVTVATWIIDYLRQSTQVPLPPFVVRLTGADYAAAQELLLAAGILTVPELDDAIQQAIALARKAQLSAP